MAFILNQFSQGISRRAASGVNMGLFCAGLVLLQFCTVCSNIHLLPKYVIVSDDKVPREVFRPDKNARQVPHAVKEMLLGAHSITSQTSPPTSVVELQCYNDGLIVGIRKDFFKTLDAYKDLTLGTCPINEHTSTHFNFKYYLFTDCGYKVEVHPSVVTLGTILHYQPSSHILREMPFDILLQCNYFKFYHSYKVGFYPELQGGTVFKALAPKSDDDLGQVIDIPIAKTYTLGQPMYFVARQPTGTAATEHQRTYINKCFITASPNPHSTPKYTIIDNQGCMLDGKVTQQSMFHPDASLLVQKFSVGSLIFRDWASSSQNLYLHCEVFVGDPTPTPSLKACNYDATTSSWRELYGPDSVCTCCDYKCSGTYRPFAKMISSPSWTVSKGENVGATLPKPFAAQTFSDDDPDMDWSIWGLE